MSEKINIAVFGADGQLGMSIKNISTNYPQYSFVFTDVNDVDITNYHQINNFVDEHNPQIFINCAAYTAVDKAETEYDKVKKINVEAAENLAIIAEKNDIFLLHISTDYVFEGKACKPYKENDETCPKTAYGSSKKMGEIYILETDCRCAIIRTSWLYSEYGDNFVKTMLRLSEERAQINVVCDQVGTPTYAGDLANAIMEIIAQNDKIEKQEIFHYSNEGVASWYDFALEVMRFAGKSTEILPISTEQYPTATKRPYYSVLDKQKIKSLFSIKIPHWKNSLEVCMCHVLNKIDN